VLQQTYRNIEAIVVNDGSPDNTDEVMQPYLSDSRVVYIKQQNAGQAVAKNNGIAKATGEFIGFLDADDIWEPNKIERQLPLFARPEVGVVYCRVNYMDENGAPLPMEVRDLLAPRRGKITAHIFKDNLIPFCAAVVRRECFDRVGVMDTSFRMGIDWDLWLRMSVHYEFDYVDEPLLRYRVGHSGQMSKNFLVRYEDTMRIMRQFLDTNPGLLPAGLVSWSLAYSYCNRGYYFRSHDAWKSLGFYLKAIRARWHHGAAYFGIVKLGAFKVLSPFGFRR
jgi:glycosyltransferase involved in cell wall biosynthesis